MSPLARLQSLRTRRLEPEWMDAPDVDPVQLRQSLTFIRRINAVLGYTRTTIGRLERLAAGWPGDRPMSILDVATGSGDVPRAILRTWPDRPVAVTGVDLHAATVRTAAGGKPDPRLTFMRADATALPFADRSFDFVLCSMFLHHLPDTATVTVLKEINRVARHGIIVADLLRSRRAYGWITLLTIGANPMVRHDARSSVAAAYTTDELQSLFEAAGVSGVEPTRHFGHRVVFAKARSKQGVDHQTAVEEMTAGQSAGRRGAGEPIPEEGAAD
jgi:ubiquinone/menaquinone biosynthesis C-methylase UbiE